MGVYIGVGNESFRTARRSEYVDKSMLIDEVNGMLFTEFKCACVSRGRRFGKSMAAEMLRAYYDKSCDSANLFDDLKIAQCASYREHLNRYPVIYLDVTSFTSRYPENEDIVDLLQKALKEDVAKAYPQVDLLDGDDLMEYLIRVATATGEKFVMIIDEWDAICREFPNGKPMDRYVSMLRRLFKDANTDNVFAGVYMTGILPIKKYKTESALNNFREYSVVDPGNLAGYFGFTKAEVMALCDKHGMDFDEMEKWFDGYQIGREKSVFNPNSVMEAIRRQECDSYWGRTGAFDNVAHYINMNYDGLKDAIINMLGGGRTYVDCSSFANDMRAVHNVDDALTVLIHLGYLAFDKKNSQCYVPNLEVRKELERAVRSCGWTNIIDAIRASERLLQCIMDGEAEEVALGVDAVHSESTSILSYNDENSLSCVVNLAFYYAKNDYIWHRELPTGRGFADLVLVPRRNVGGPAILIELKYKADADTAIRQIHEKRYVSKVSQYTGDVILVGINYDKETKTHTCEIERTTI